MRVLRIALLLMVVASGCGGGFRDEAEEREYLNSVASPTPEQFRRRRELEAAHQKDIDAEVERLKTFPRQ